MALITLCQTAALDGSCEITILQAVRINFLEYWSNFSSTVKECAKRYSRSSSGVYLAIDMKRDRIDPSLVDLGSNEAECFTLK